MLLSDPWALTKFAEHEVVLPLVVIGELEGKRHHPELGYFARQALRILDDLRIEHGRLDAAGAGRRRTGGTLHVELNHTDPMVLPAGFRNDTNDSRILACALNLAAERPRAVVAGVQGHAAAGQGLGGRAGRRRVPGAGHACRRAGPGWPSCEVARRAGRHAVPRRAGGHRCGPRPALPHRRQAAHSRPGSALGRVTPGKQVRLVRGEREAFGLRGRSAEQRIALDLLMDDEVGIVSLGGRAGTGKSALALCAGLELVMERRAHRKVVVFRPLYAVGGQELGYLPGSENEKMGPWAQAVFDTLSAVASPAVIEEVIARGMLEVLPLTHIRGRSLHDSFVIVDEAQSLERNVLLTVLSRLGHQFAGGADPRRRAAGQPAGGPARRNRRGDRGAQGASAVRPRHPDPVGALADRGVGHRDAGASGPAVIRRAERAPRGSGSGTGQ